MGNCKDCHDCDCGESCDSIDREDVAERWLKELRLDRERAMACAEKQKLFRKPSVVRPLVVRMPKKAICPTCNGACEDLDGCVCTDCNGLGIIKEDD